MSPKDEARRRVLLALDAASAARDALEQAGPLAESLGAELSGLFVEDERFLDLAGAVGLIGVDAGGEPRRFDRASARRAFEAAAHLQRELVERAALERRVPWSFAVSRGTLDAQLRDIRTRAEVMVVAATRRRRHHKSATLVVALDWPHEGTLALVTRLTPAGPVLAIVPAGHPEVRRWLEERAPAGSRIRFCEVEHVGPRAVAEQLHDIESSLIVAPAVEGWLAPEALAAIRARAPLLLVR